MALAALLVGALATARVAAFGFLDKRPHYGGAETGDLGVLMRNHMTFQDPDGFNLEHLLHLMRLEHHQPPLYYQGIPALFSPADHLTFGPLLVTNALALVVALWAAWKFGVHHGKPRLGLIAVLVMVSLRGVAGRFTVLGVEPWHMALLGVAFVLFLRLREPDATRWQALLLGGVIGAGLLLKLPFVAGLLGPLALESGCALLGGPPARRWLRHLLLAGGVVVLLLAAGFLPFTTGATDFFLMARSEPTHPTIFSFDAVWSLVWWTMVGIGPIGFILFLLALWGAERGSLLKTPAPILGFRPVVLLVASIVTLGAIHWYIPHKELRYLLPAAWPFCLIMAIGLDALWADGRHGRRAVVGGILALFLSTFVIPRGTAMSDINGPIIPLLYDPQVPHFLGMEDPAELEPPLLRLWIDRSDYGLDNLVRHASFEELNRPTVLATFDDPTYTRLRDMLYWELYARNERPVLSLPKVDSLLGEAVKGQLMMATHLVTNRQLEREELRVLRAQRYVPTESVDLPLPGPKRWTLWVKLPQQQTFDEFSQHLGEWTFWSDTPDEETASYRLQLSPPTDGRPGGAAQIVPRRRGPRTDSESPEQETESKESGPSFAMQRLFTKVSDFHLSFDWRTHSDSPSAPPVWLDVVDAVDGTLLHRQDLSVPGAPDTGWLALPPTDLSDVLPPGEPRDIYLRIGLRDDGPPGAQHILLVDNFRMDREGRERPPDVLLSSDDGESTAGIADPIVEPWSLWRLGSSTPTEDCSVSLDETEGTPSPAVHATGVHKGPRKTPRYGIERTVPVTLPFSVSMDWKSKDTSGGTPPLTFELLQAGGRLVHSWTLSGDEGWNHYEPPDLSPNLLGIPEVIVRIGVLDTDGSSADSAFWIDNFSWTTPCAAPRPYFKDLDGDGRGDPAFRHPYGDLCYSFSGWVTDSSDCDDEEQDIYGGGEELCDGLDNDCDPSTAVDGEHDEDGDGQLACDGDCDDSDPTTYRGATEVCDDVDNNCDGQIEDAATDNDVDGYFLCDGDCDDDNPDIWPGAVEGCGDGIDQDCDGTEARDGIDPECVPESPPPE